MVQGEALLDQWMGGSDDCSESEVFGRDFGNAKALQESASFGL
jgi:hypothetical protein